jgi:hypothetical protein
MNKLLASFLLLCFILWILPLGFFIKPAMQKLACDGQRAMCMCYAMGHKPADKAMETGISLKAGVSSNKENPSSGSSNYFVSVKPVLAVKLHSASIFENQFLSYKNPFLAAVDYVPKV